ncbi:MAG TPA: hypothetical protein VNV87_07740 [Acidimicrobiales bacterium]|nr:hypothetical protein [Acidimicrobiales bacterium]
MAVTATVISSGSSASAQPNPTNPGSNFAFIPTPFPYVSSQLAAIACVANGTCYAVGTMSTSPNLDTLADDVGFVLTFTNLGAMDLPQVLATGIRMTAISCSRGCIATGAGATTSDVFYGEGFAQSLVGTTGQFNAVDCPTVGTGNATDCLIAGTDGSNGVLWQLTGTSIVVGNVSANTAYYGAACNAGACVAVGNVRSSGQSQGVVGSPQYAAPTDSVMSSVAEIPVAGTTSLLGVTCPNSSCTAVGQVDIASSSSEGVAMQIPTLPLTAGQLSAGRLIQGSGYSNGAPADGLESYNAVAVACPDGITCDTVGHLSNSGSPGNAYVTSLSGGVPGPIVDQGPFTVLNGATCAGDLCYAVGSGDFNGNGPIGLVDIVSESPVSGSGYWLAGADGSLYNFGDASPLQLARSPSTAAIGANTSSISNLASLNGLIVGMASTSDAKGLWLTGADGGVFSLGDAQFYGSMGGQHLNQPVVGMTRTKDGNGYWLVASDGGIFSFGDAQFYGSMGGMPLNQPIVGIAATPDGGGYWEVASDGGIFSFGDAQFYGSMGGTPLNKPVVGMASTPDGGGYWLVASDGGIFSFGDAQFWGSEGGIPLNAPVKGMLASPDGHGYLLVATDGGIFKFGDAGFFGSMGGIQLSAPIVAISSS